MSDIVVNREFGSSTPGSRDRAVIVDAKNAVVKVEALPATQPREAAVIIHRMAAAGYIDLWDGRCIIQRFRPEDF